ncbi:MAG TPA: hypothetical protein V6D17_15100 [Candidatus Obscuribacterales bacterium]
MRRLILALLFAFMAVVTPASALCASGAEQAACVCSLSFDAGCAHMSGSCCAASEQITAAPYSRTVQSGSVAPPAFSGFALAEAAQRQLFGFFMRAPLHLASNKIYLSKCSLLI